MARNSNTATTTDEPKVAPQVLSPDALEFGEPPASNRGPREDVRLVVDALKARPGEWAKIVKDASMSTATRWRKNGLEVRADRSGQPEGSTRVDLWARYVPQTEAVSDGEAEPTE